MYTPYHGLHTPYCRTPNFDTYTCITAVGCYGAHSMVYKIECVVKSSGSQVASLSSKTTWRHLKIDMFETQKAIHGVDGHTCSNWKQSIRWMTAIAKKKNTHTRKGYAYSAWPPVIRPLRVHCTCTCTCSLPL